jgi:AP-1 complex subunit beta-1
MQAFPHLSFSAEDDLSREKALQTVVAGQQAENLLDFDDTPADGAPSGLAATTASIAATPAGAQFQTSTNPLDDLVSIFGSTGLGQPTSPPLSSGPPPLSALSLGTSTPTSIMSPVQSKPTSQQSQQEDLLGLF